MDKEERIKFANQVFCAEAQKQGLHICSWESLPSWNSFVNGQIDEQQLTELAGKEISQFAVSFSKFAVVDKAKEVEDPRKVQTAKAKEANKIYRKVCTESGKSMCFFKDFTSWQEFIEGRIGADELHRKAMEEIRELVQEEPH